MTPAQRVTPGFWHVVAIWCVLWVLTAGAVAFVVFGPYYAWISVCKWRGQPMDLNRIASWGMGVTALFITGVVVWSLVVVGQKLWAMAVDMASTDRSEL
jgi:hypothetical protein